MKIYQLVDPLPDVPIERHSVGAMFVGSSESQYPRKDYVYRGRSPWKASLSGPASP